MNKYVCTTCGIQYPISQEVPDRCHICEEERQYVNPNGQSWTTLDEMIRSGLYQNTILEEEAGLYSITTTPKFGIGQTAYLIKTGGLNILWDCVTYLDQETIQTIEELGGIDAIAVSHPHYYSTQLEWAERFDAHLYLHRDDQSFVMEPGERIRFWDGEELTLNDEVSLYRLGGHFKGGAVLHWSLSGILLTGDIIQVVADTDWVSFMYSYPNLIPLPAGKVKEMAEKVKHLSFSKLYNAFHRVVGKDADQVVQRSAERYIMALEGKLFST
ncbi:MBL fold metallo-hydrolase [Rossellomorea aquimaris]|uniref:MBL fold metallo-hydrolase n=1 Tax=Rossellomorea aquimaris TaxID=189382 RepID=UPI0005C82B73|nr:MBL fold metallo-hydrolase [Rossellomorea aquimaris]